MNNKKVSTLIKVVKILIFVIAVSSALLYIINSKPECKPCYLTTSILKVIQEEGVDTNLTNKITALSIEQLQKIQSQDYKKIHSIPLITHHIYFTSNTSPTPIKETVLSNIINSISRLHNYNNKFTHYFWTNNPEIIPIEITKIPNLIVKNISEFKKDKLYSYLISSIEKGQRQSTYFVEASDIFRIISIYKYGGIYTDLDYEIYNADILMQYIESFNFIAGTESHKLSSHFFVTNAFIASKPKHPVIAEYKRILQRNLSKSEPLPNYIKFPCSTFDSIINSSGPTALTISIYNKLDAGKNKDILLPVKMLIDNSAPNSPKTTKKILAAPLMQSFEGIQYRETIIGNDSYSCSWCKGSKKQICYE